MSDENTPSKADIEKLQSQIAALNEQLEAEAAKTARAVDEAKAAKAEARKLKEIDPADVEKLESENEKLRAELADANKAIKVATTERDKAVKTLESEQAFTQKLLIQDGIKSALIANGVKDEDFIDTLSAKFATGASVKVEGDARLALIGDKPVADAIKEWAGSESGKKFVAAPVNTGGGAGGGGGQGGGKTITRAEYNADPIAGAKAIKEGATIVDAPAA